MQYITDANKRQEERREKEKKYETARKQAVSKVKTESWTKIEAKSDPLDHSST